MPATPHRLQRVSLNETPVHDGWRIFAFGLLLLGLILAVYAPAWRGGLLWDDDAHITRPELRSVAGLVRIWIEPGATVQYYPVLHTAFWIQHRLFDENVSGY